MWCLEASKSAPSACASVDAFGMGGWVSAVQSGVGLAVSLSFYATLLVASRLDDAFHWLLCNVAIAEVQVIRSIVELVGFAAGREFRSRLTSLRDSHNSSDDEWKNSPEFKIVMNENLQLKETLSVCSGACMMSAATFILVCLWQQYGRYRSPRSCSEKFGRRSAALVCVVWATSIAYFSVQVTLIRTASSMAYFTRHTVVYFTYMDALFVVVWSLGVGAVLGAQLRLLRRGGFREALPFDEAARVLCESEALKERRRAKWARRLRVLACGSLASLCFGVLFVMNRGVALARLHGGPKRPLLVALAATHALYSTHFFMLTVLLPALWSQALRPT